MILNSLELLKIDLGITHTKRDEFFKTLLDSTQKELEGKGLKFSDENTETLTLLTDYAAWKYRARLDSSRLGVMPQNIRYRLRVLQMKERCDLNAE